MKRFIATNIGLFVFITIINAQIHQAYLFIIGTYPKSSEWWSIHAENDAMLLCPILVEQGFVVEILENEEATKSNILKQFSNIAKRAKKGDAIYIHFSCHGQQMEDDNGDEPDGWDEALIPYDALMTYEKGEYEGENHLRDDEINHFLIDLRRKLGKEGCVVVTLDACHSGSGTREETIDEMVVRGTAFPFTSSPEKYLADMMTNKEKMCRYVDVPLLADVVLAPLTVVSACKSYQVNREIQTSDGVKCGPLSYALSQVWKTHALIKPQSWSEEVKNMMKKVSKQNPVIESTISDVK